MSSKRVALLLAALFCLCALAPSGLFAQSASTGTVAGTVTDPSGGAIVGATVTLTDTATSIARTDATNDNGRYFFANVVPSKYTVSVSKTGFRVSKLVDQVVSVGASLTLNLDSGNWLCGGDCGSYGHQWRRTADPERYGR